MRQSLRSAVEICLKRGLAGLAAVGLAMGLSFPAGALNAAHTINALAYSPDGQLALSGDNSGVLRVWNVSSGQRSTLETGGNQPINSLEFSADGKKIIAAVGWAVVIWDAASGKAIQTFKDHHQRVLAASLSPDGSLALSGGSDDTVRLWNAATGEEIWAIEGHEDGIQGVAFSADGAFAISAAGDKTIKIWDIKKKTLKKFMLAPDTIWSLRRSNDGKFLLTRTQNAVQLWDFASAKMLYSWTLPDEIDIHAIAFSPDGRYAFAGSDWNTGSSSDIQYIQAWDTASGSVAKSIQLKPKLVSLAISPDGKNFLTGSPYDLLQLWSWDQGQVTATWPHSDEPQPENNY